MNSPVLIVERPDDATAIVTLSRPERRNALTIELMELLCGTLKSLAAEPGRRVVILRGAGPAFCAGLDLDEAADAGLAERSGNCVAETFQILATSPLVTVAAAHGAAYAGGAGLLACCDFVVAADNLRICFPEVRRGLVPALAATAMGLRLREADLRQLVLLGEPVDARRALCIGLVDGVVAPERLMAEAQDIAATVLKGAPEAVCQTKRLLGELRRADPATLFSRALDVHKQARLSEEAREGIAAFRDKREPSWAGKGRVGQ